MTIKTILFADNHVEFLDTRVEFLERAGYRVLKADSPEEVKRKLAMNWVHLLIVDIRLENDDDVEDTSGIHIAREPMYELIPKIVLTSYPSYEYVRKVMRLGAAELPPAVDFLSKRDGPQTMLQAVEETFARYVKINWDLLINHGTRCNYLINGFARLLQPELEAALVDSRSAEIEDLLRLLFADSQQITIDRLLWQKTERVALVVVAYERGGLGQQFIVTCGLIGAVNREAEKFKTLNSQIRNHIHFTRYAATLHYGANRYELTDCNLETVRNLEEFLRQESTRDVNAALANLVQPSLKCWREDRRIAEGNQPIDLLFRQRLGLEYISGEDLETRIRGISAEAAQAGLARVEFSTTTLAFQLPSGRQYIYPNPILWILGGHPESLKSIILTGQTMGEMDISAILVGNDGQCWLTDFGFIDEGPLLGDLAALETAIKFDIIEDGLLEDIHEMEMLLLTAARLNQRIETGPQPFRKIMSAVHQLRRLAYSIGDQPIELYYWGLLSYAVKRLLLYKPEIRHSQRELTSFIHLGMCIGLIVARLEKADSRNSSSDDKQTGVAVNMPNHEISVNGSPIDLTPTEFNIILVLWNNRGQLCSREAIFKTFSHEQYRGGKASSHDAQINVYIQRIREKLEINPNTRTYLVTRRGRGYILFPTGRPRPE